MIFVSHANPEDNDIARWLSLQLAIAGYPVWCDVTKLLGGEKFWEVIQKAIASDTTKFVFVLSGNSNKKSGALDELNCALGAEKQRGPRFVITLRIDDIPYDDVYIQIQRRNHIDFASSWATGLSTLLARLEEDKVPRKEGYWPTSLA